MWWQMESMLVIIVLALLASLRASQGQLFSISSKFSSNQRTIVWRSTTTTTASCLDACTVCACGLDGGVDCSSLGLTEVPCNFPNTTLQMFDWWCSSFCCSLFLSVFASDLSHNALSFVPPNAFAGLIDVDNLYTRRCIHINRITLFKVTSRQPADNAAEWLARWLAKPHQCVCRFILKQHMNNLNCLV